MQNSVNLIGHLGSDVEKKDFENGGVVANFSLATNESYKDKDGVKVEKTEWHRIVVNGELANICEKFINKGSLVAVEGKLRTRDWLKDEVKHYATEIVADKVIFLDKKPS